MTIERARDELRSVAKVLGQLAADAAKQGSFDETIAIARWASAIADLVGEAERPAQLALENKAPLAGAKGSAARVASKRARRPRENYPRFRRDGSSLVKVAWSKKERTEYEQ